MLPNEVGRRNMTESREAVLLGCEKGHVYQGIAEWTGYPCPHGVASGELCTRPLTVLVAGIGAEDD